MSTVIKAGQSKKILHRLSAVDLADHLREARAMVEMARRQAAEICARAEEEARQIRARARSEAQQTGYNAGRDQGYKEGLQAGTLTGRQEAFDQASAKFHEEQSHVVADLHRAISEIDRIKDAVRADAERHVLDFAIKLATKLTYAIGTVSCAGAQANLARALELVHERTNLTVRLHPADLNAFEQLSPPAAEQLKGGRAAVFIADEAVARGGCVVHTARTEVDATLDTQLSEIVSLLLARESEPALQFDRAREAAAP